jgi:hypothetical protein
MEPIRPKITFLELSKNYVIDLSYNGSGSSVEFNFWAGICLKREQVGGSIASDAEKLAKPFAL